MGAARRKRDGSSGRPALGAAQVLDAIFGMAASGVGQGRRASRPGNSGGAKAPDFRRACEVGEDRGDWRSACKTPTTIRSRPNKLYGKAKATPIGRRRRPAVKSVGKPDALIGHVRFDERGRETERLAKPQAATPPQLYWRSPRARPQSDARRGRARRLADVAGYRAKVRRRSRRGRAKSSTGRLPKAI